MISINEKKQCSGCHACSNACPKNCIQMVSDEEGFWYPQVNKDQCIDCGMCEKVCPIIHKWQPDDSRTTTAMAAMNKNEEIRLKSSSGGIFTLIAESIIDQGGVVFGAAFADDFKSVHHICVNNKVDLEKLRGSKYVQSKIGDTYKQAKEYLDSGRKVLFTGTPCQIGGLYSFLLKDYDNLYTQDIICHGVPSPMVWEKYVEELEKKAAAVTKHMSFRNKTKGWKSYSVSFDFKNSKRYIRSHSDDSYIKAFISNICLRPTCYTCSFKSIKRQADLTLADFWGIQNVLPEMDDDKGTSLVLMHSPKGTTLLDSISDNIRCVKVDTDVVNKFNSAGVKSCNFNPKREIFLKDIQNNDFEITVAKYTRVSLYRKARRFAGRVKRKIKKMIKS